MTKYRIASFVCVAMLAVMGGMVALADTVDLSGINCLIAPKAANPEKSAEYKEGKVYFCCGNCAGKYKEAPEKFATKANMQLVATKQYVQKSCPLSGGPLNPDTKLKVGDAEVAFCCNNCKGKVAGTEAAADQLELVFSDKAFEKAGFAKAEAK